MRIDVVTIFPDYFMPLALSLLGKASAAGLIEVHIHDLRTFAHDRHNSVDDTPFGGGPGMVMGPQPWGEALDEIAATNNALRPVLVVPTPSGAVFDQRMAQAWSTDPWLVFACGRYEGIDARVAQYYAGRSDWAGVREVGIGDYVLAGGEVATLVMVETVVRLLPGVVGNEASVTDDSFAAGSMAQLVEGPVFTKPQEWRGLEVPEVLRSGHHGQIASWRAEQARLRTAQMRPELAAGTHGLQH